MEKIQKNRGITLIALVITIIVLLILAGISIATLTGENGILTKASKADKETDITETKEQIKIEIMGVLDDQKTNYTNSDVITAVEKITGKQVAENDEIVKSKKENDVDISDLWVTNNLIHFSINGTPYEIEKGITWDAYLSKNNPDDCFGWLWDIQTDAIFHYDDDIGSQLFGSWLVDEEENFVYRTDLIKSRKLYFANRCTLS